MDETVDAYDFGPDDQGVGVLLAHLVVRRSGGSEVVDVPDGSEITIGRSLSSVVLVDDSRVSRDHARIRRSGGELWLRDLGSRNGTRVGSGTVLNEERRIAAGDVIRLGDVEIIVAAAWRPTPREAPGSKGAPARGAPAPTALPAPEGLSEGVVVADRAMVDVYHLARRVARTATSVLITGETGAGKEIVAGQIHHLSPRASRPFVRLSCASLSASLVESELFGHEKGAFTGADRRKIGHIEAAHEGTLFLDEIGELSPDMQVKLLRVLETRTLTRVGGTAEIPVDVRLLSATHKDLRAEIKAGRFREDLYFRLCPFSLHVPPLRERPAEIVLLAELFARECAARIDAPPPVISREASAVLAAYAWPGNVRELRNAMEHAIVVAEDDRLEPAHLPAVVRGQRPESGGAGAATGPMRAMVEETERRSIEDALAAEGGNQTRAAKRLGISRRWLLHKIERYGIGRPRRGG